MSVTGDNDNHNSDELWKGAYQLIFFTPESLLLNRRWQRLLSSSVYQERVKALVIDEAHTVQKW